MPRGQEALHELWQDTDRRLDPQRFGGSEAEQNKWKRSEQRVGKPMSHMQLATYVTRSNPSIIMETSLSAPENAGLYLVHRGGKKYLVAFAKGSLPEWSIIETDRADLPVREVRGWRTVLLRLLKQKALTFTQVSRIVQEHYGFSPVVWNRVWREHVRDFC